MTASIPALIPVMTLPGAVFFPKTVLPLRIFEPRYRRMLEEVLDSHRIFAVAGIDPTATEVQADREPPLRIASAGIIRACQKDEDGTSILFLEGLARIEILSVIREEPYRIVEVRTLQEASSAPPTTLEKLRLDLIRAFSLRAKLDAKIPSELRRAVTEINDASALCDLIVFSLFRDDRFKQRMLETLDPAARIRESIVRIRRDIDQRGLQIRTQGRLPDESIGLN